MSLGLNYRMNDLQAALGIEQLKINFFVKKRNQIIKKYYNEQFKKLKIETPFNKKKYSLHFFYI